MATFVVETGTGVPGANALTDVAFADAYFDDLVVPANWAAASTSEKELDLRVGTTYLETVFGPAWEGYKADETFPLSWPRTGVVDFNGYLIASDVVPVRVQQATAILASKNRDLIVAGTGSLMLADFAPDGASKILKERSKLGPLEEEFQYSEPGKLQAGIQTRYVEVEALLHGLYDPQLLVGLGGGGFQSTVERS